ncbi:MAG: CoA ester lyase, partial [Clostridia bacterium]|nr:CoA ester lyase [Clostridia bacterium]
NLAKDLGFTGKASISPRHVEVINEVFTPTEKEVDYAYEVIEAIALAKADERVQTALDGKTIVKEIAVPNKIVNIVVR